MLIFVVVGNVNSQQKLLYVKELVRVSFQILQDINLIEGLECRSQFPKLAN